MEKWEERYYPSPSTPPSNPPPLPPLSLYIYIYIYVPVYLSFLNISSRGGEKSYIKNIYILKLILKPLSVKLKVKDRGVLEYPSVFHLWVQQKCRHPFSPSVGNLRIWPLGGRGLLSWSAPVLPRRGIERSDQRLQWWYVHLCRSWSHVCVRVYIPFEKQILRHGGGRPIQKGGRGRHRRRPPKRWQEDREKCHMPAFCFFICFYRRDLAILDPC